jgi:hypothetical protein
MYYAQAIGTSRSITPRTLMALNEEPGFRGVRRTEDGRRVALWETEATARRANPAFGGRLLTVYRASGRPE